MNLMKLVTKLENGRDEILGVTNVAPSIDYDEYTSRCIPNQVILQFAVAILPTLFKESISVEESTFNRRGDLVSIRVNYLNDDGERTACYLNLKTVEWI